MILDRGRNLEVQTRNKYPHKIAYNVEAVFDWPTTRIGQKINYSQLGGGIKGTNKKRNKNAYCKSHKIRALMRY